MIKRAQSEDIQSILNLLEQVDMVHHSGRPDLFKGPAMLMQSTSVAIM